MKKVIPTWCGSGSATAFVASPYPTSTTNKFEKLEISLSDLYPDLRQKDVLPLRLSVKRKFSTSTVFAHAVLVVTVKIEKIMKTSTLSYVGMLLLLAESTVA
jgi:hypothetical protein